MYEPDEWTSQWPTEPGWYWLWAKVFGDEEYKLRPLRVVEARGRGDKPSLVFIYEGNFLYREDVKCGQFIKAEVPTLPLN